MIPVVSIYSSLMVKKEESTGLSKLLEPVLFLLGYLSLYALLGCGLFAIVFGAFQAGAALPWLSSFSGAGVAAVLLVAGMWQLTPLKEKSLSKCISPMGFFMTHAKKGLSGAFRMGAEHGYYCVACSWLYMLVMLAVAAMSILSMIVLSGLIIVEKVFIGGRTSFKWFSAALFFLLAALVLIFPASLVIGL
jgi:predicted metal-binding membrane protein